MTEARNLLILFGGAPHDRTASRFLKFLCEEFCDSGWLPQVVDPDELNLPIMTAPHDAYEPGTAPPALETVARMIGKADALVVACGEHNHGIPPSLKNLLDHFGGTTLRKPAAIATYSTSHCGGVRSALQLRMSLGELGMVTVPTTYAVPQVSMSLSESGAPSDPKFLQEFALFESDLRWWSDAASRNRSTEMPDNVVDILTLLEREDWADASGETAWFHTAAEPRKALRAQEVNSPC